MSFNKEDLRTKRSGSPPALPAAPTRRLLSPRPGKKEKKSPKTKGEGKKIPFAGGKTIPKGKKTHFVVNVEILPAYKLPREGTSSTNRKRGTA